MSKNSTESIRLATGDTEQLEMAPGDTERLEMAAGDTERLEDDEDRAVVPEPSSLPTRASHPGRDFARLYPVNEAAKFAFHDIAVRVRSMKEWQPHVRKFIHINDAEEIVNTMYEEDTLDSDATDVGRTIRTGHYRFNLDILPARFALGWVLGAGRPDVPDSVDLLLTLRGSSHKVRGRHAQILYHKENRVLMLRVQKGQTAILNGTVLTDDEQLLYERSMGLTLGDLTYRLEFETLDAEYDQKLDALSRVMTSWAKARRSSIDPTPSAGHFTLGGYQMQGARDAGSFALVFPCLRISDGAIFAAKRTQRNKYSFHETENEVSILKRLDEHAHTCSLVDVLYSNGDRYSMGSTRVNDIYMIIKPFASDLTFDSLDESFSTRMTAFQQCCEGLRHVHSCGIIHRDIKPANILIAKREPLLIILADFGHSTMQMESQDHMRGTLSYLPPEIVEMKEKGPTDGMYWSQACDVFSLGVVGYELFHGRFERVKQKKWIDEAIRTGLTETLTRSGRNIDKLLISMLSRDNTKRPSASQILDVYFPAKSQTDDVEHKRKHDAI